ncbi:MAG: shikimate dehydrogenase, partial [Crocosphaera sp.]
MNEPVTVTYSLEEMFSRLEQKIDNNQRELNHKLETLQKDVTDLKVGQARLEEKLTGDIKALDTKVQGMDNRLKTVEG